MGRVYKVRDLVNKRVVALKLVRPELSEDEIILKRLKRELEVTSQTDSPHVVKTYELDRIGDTSFITMEFIDGDTLADILKKEGHLSVEETLNHALQILEGLKAAHEGQVIHRDLKPSNIMVHSDGRSVITDFGLARPGGDVTKISKTAAILGTPQYVAPEQWKGMPPTSGTDIYAFGVILYEMLCGRTPFTADTDFGYLQHHLNTPPDFKVKSLANLPGFLRHIILKCLEKSPEHRYSDVDEIIEDINKQKVKGEASANVRRAAGKVPKKLWVTALILLFIGAGYYIADSYLIKTKPEKFHFAVMPFKPLSDEKKVKSWSKKLPDFISSSLSEEKKITLIPYLQVRSKYGSKPINRAKEDIFNNTETEYLVSGTFNKKDDDYIVDVTVHRRGDDDPFYTKEFKTKGKSLFAFNSRISRSIKEHLGIKTLTTRTLLEINSIPITTTSLDAKEYYILALDLSYKRKYNNAVQLFKKALEIDSSISLAHYQIIECYSLTAETSKINYHVKLVKNNIRHLTEEENFLIKTHIAIHFEKDFRKSYIIKKEFAQKHPNNYIAINHLALSHLKNGNLSGANKLFQQLYSKFNQSTVIKHLIAINIRKYNVQYARQLLSEANTFEDKPSWFDLYSWIINILEHNYTNAIKIGEQRMFEYPLDPKGYRYTGLAYLFNNQYTEAFQTFENLIKSTKLSENIAKCLLHQSNILIHEGKIKKAIQILKKSLKISKKNKLYYLFTTTLNKLAKLHYEIGKYCDAKEFFHQVDLFYLSQKLESDYLYMEYFKALTYSKLDNLENYNSITNSILHKNLNIQRLNNRIIIDLVKKDRSIKKHKASITNPYKGLYEMLNGEINSTGDHHAFILYLSAEYDLKNKRIKDALITYNKIRTLTLGRINYGIYYSLSYYKSGCIYQKLNQKKDALKQFTEFLNLWKNGDRESTSSDRRCREKVN